MDFALKVVLSFLVGGAYVSGVIWASEKLGSRIGGAIAGLPSTILVGLAFIDLTEGPVAVHSAVAVVPLMFFATLIYGLVFMNSVEKIKHKNKAFLATLVALGVWLVIILGIRKFSDFSFLSVVSATFIGLLGFKYAFRNFQTIVPSNIILPKHIYFFRFVIGGAVIAGSVLAARYAGPQWGGIVSCVPAVLGSVLYFLSKSQGGKFLQGFLRRLPMGYISSLIFMVLIHQLILKLSGIYTFAIAMAVATAYTFLLITLKPGPEK